MLACIASIHAEAERIQSVFDGEDVRRTACGI